MFTFLFGLFLKFMIHLLFLIGISLNIFAFATRFVPTFNVYKLPANIVGCIALGFALYLQGQEDYKAKIAKQTTQLEAKLAQAQTESKKVNTQIETKFINQTKVIHEKGNDIIHEIQVESSKMDTDCKISPEVIDIHNKAALLSGDTK
jgi:hypothetical protein